MKSLALAIALVPTLIAFPLYSQTQIEMNASSAAECDEAEAELSQVYRAIVLSYQDDRIFLEELRSAQESWTRFRYDHLNCLHPAESKRLECGSVFPMCVALAKADLTRSRTVQLRRWLEGKEEGETCSGSIRMNHELRELQNSR